jgi:hypothetical protein
MSAPSAPTPHPPEKSDTFAPNPRQRTTIYLTCTLLFLSALVLLFVPSTKLTLPGRLALASLNLVLAATLALIVRQKSAPPAPPAGPDAKP